MTFKRKIILALPHQHQEKIRVFYRNLRAWISEGFWWSIPLINIVNILRYGFKGPRSLDILKVDPNIIVHQIPGFKRRYSGKVIPSERWLDIKPVGKNNLFDIISWRLQTGSWTGSGAFERMRRVIARNPGADGCRTEADIIKRYQRLDKLIEEIRLGGEIRADWRDGIFVGVSDVGEIVLCRAGFHRLMLARAMGLPYINAHVGFVHRDAVVSGLYDELRRDSRRDGCV